MGLNKLFREWDKLHLKLLLQSPTRTVQSRNRKPLSALSAPILSDTAPFLHAIIQPVTFVLLECEPCTRASFALTVEHVLSKDSVSVGNANRQH